MADPLSPMAGQHQQGTSSKSTSRFSSICGLFLPCAMATWRTQQQADSPHLSMAVCASRRSNSNCSHQPAPLAALSNATTPQQQRPSLGCPSSPNSSSNNQQQPCTIQAEPRSSRPSSPPRSSAITCRYNATPTSAQQHGNTNSSPDLLQQRLQQQHGDHRRALTRTASSNGDTASPL